MDALYSSNLTVAGSGISATPSSTACIRHGRSPTDASRPFGSCRSRAIQHLSDADFDGADRLSAIAQARLATTLPPPSSSAELEYGRISQRADSSRRRRLDSQETARKPAVDLGPGLRAWPLHHAKSTCAECHGPRSQGIRRAWCHDPTSIVAGAYSRAEFDAAADQGIAERRPQDQDPASWPAVGRDSFLTFHCRTSATRSLFVSRTR